jgi:hypothetical protein
MEEKKIKNKIRYEKSKEKKNKLNSYLRNVGVSIAQLASDNDGSSGEVK